MTRTKQTCRKSSGVNAPPALVLPPPTDRENWHKNANPTPALTHGLPTLQLQSLCRRGGVLAETEDALVALGDFIDETLSQMILLDSNSDSESDRESERDFGGYKLPWGVKALLGQVRGDEGLNEQLSMAVDGVLEQVIPDAEKFLCEQAMDVIVDTVYFLCEGLLRVPRVQSPPSTIATSFMEMNADGEDTEWEGQLSDDVTVSLFLCNGEVADGFQALPEESFVECITLEDVKGMVSAFYSGEMAKFALINIDKAIASFTASDDLLMRTRAGLQFHPEHIVRLVDQPMTEQAAVGFAAAIEYLVAELVEVAGLQQEASVARIVPHHILEGVLKDVELSGLLGKCCIRSGGVLQNISPAFFPLIKDSIQGEVVAAVTESEREGQSEADNAHCHFQTLRLRQIRKFQQTTSLLLSEEKFSDKVSQALGGAENPFSEEDLSCMQCIVEDSVIRLCQEANHIVAFGAEMSVLAKRKATGMETKAHRKQRYIMEGQDVNRGRWQLMDPREAAWERRWPLMSVVTGCGFRPLAAKRLEQETAHARDVGFTAKLKQIDVSTPEKARAYYLSLVLSNQGLFKPIMSFP